MKNYIIIIFIIFSLFSCKNKINNIEIDELSQIDVFKKYEDNLKMSKDIVNQNWDAIFNSKIENYKGEKSKGIKFFINTRPENNKTIIQLRYPHFDKPKNLEKVRKVVIKEINETKKRYVKNKKFILEATKLSENYIELVNANKTSELYENLHEKVKKELTLKQFLSFMKKYKEKGVSKESREYYNRLLFYLTGNKSEYANFIEIHYKHKGMPNNLESFNFEVIDDTYLKFIGYRIY